MVAAILVVIEVWSAMRAAMQVAGILPCVKPIKMHGLVAVALIAICSPSFAVIRPNDAHAVSNAIEPVIVRSGNGGLIVIGSDDAVRPIVRGGSGLEVLNGAIITPNSPPVVRGSDDDLLAQMASNSPVAMPRQIRYSQSQLRRKADVVNETPPSSSPVVSMPQSPSSWQIFTVIAPVMLSILTLCLTIFIAVIRKA